MREQLEDLRQMADEVDSVSLIIVLGSKDAQVDLKAVRESSPEADKIIVASNLDSDVEIPSSAEFDYTIIRDSSATTRGSLRNLAVKACSSEFVAFLEGNSLPHPGWLKSLLAVMRRDSQTAAVGGVTIHPYSEKILQAGLDLAEDLHPLYRYREEFLQQFRQLDIGTDPLAVDGGCVLLRRTAVESVAYFDEGYVEEYEDIDLCLRLRAAGYEVALSPSSVISHYEPEITERLDHRRLNLQRLKSAIDGTDRIRTVVNQYRRACNGHTRPLVTLMYPAYNDQQFLHESINSVINQTYRNWELLIINDASTDATADILEHYQNAYPDKIKIFHKSEHNRYDAWDMLYREAAGDYVNILGADDVLMPTKLQEQVQLLQTHPSWVFVHSDCYRFGPDGKFIDYARVPFPPESRQLFELIKINYIVTPSVLFRRDCIEPSGGWMNRQFKYAQDYDLWLRLLKGRALGCSHQPLLKYRIHDWQLTAISGEKKMYGDGAGVIRHKLENWTPAELLPPLDPDCPEDIVRLYKCLDELFFSYHIVLGNLQVEILDFFNHWIDRKAPRCANQRKGLFLFKVSYNFFRRGRYKLCIKYLLKSLPLIPFFAGNLGATLRVKVRKLFGISAAKTVDSRF